MNKLKLGNKKVFLSLFALIVVLLLSVYAYTRVSNLVGEFQSKRAVMQFAWEHPQIVGRVQGDYSSKIKAAEESLLKPAEDKTPQDKLIEEVLNQYKTLK